MFRRIKLAAYEVYFKIYIKLHGSMNQISVI